ncbi:hypothetical protein [Streptomyces sp. 900116325]
METEDRSSLTDAQRSRVEFARRDLAEARTADLAVMPASSLILQVERLRGRLDDMLRLLGDLTEP